MRIVWRRELIRFVSDKAGMVAWLVQPLLFLFVLGSGLQQLSAASTDGVDLKTFIFPGMLSFAVVFTAMFSAITLVMDRELGVMREMLVAPVSRSLDPAGQGARRDDRRRLAGRRDAGARRPRRRAVRPADAGSACSRCCCSPPSP